MPLPPVASFAEFAALRGWRRSYVTALRKADRLVLTDDGKAVRVAESLARIKATEDPAKAAVAARHAAKRAKGQGPAPSSSIEKPKPAVATANDGAVEPEADDEAAREAAAALGVDDGFQYWRRRSEKARALAAERDNAVAEGKLLDAVQVTAAVAGGVTALRARLETLPDTLGPQLAAIDDEASTRSLLAEAIEHALEELSRQFGALGKPEITHG